jgi:hypothetical protein
MQRSRRGRRESSAARRVSAAFEAVEPEGTVDDIYQASYGGMPLSQRNGLHSESTHRHHHQQQLDHSSPRHLEQRGGETGLKTPTSQQTSRTVVSTPATPSSYGASEPEPARNAMGGAMGVGYGTSSHINTVGGGSSGVGATRVNSGSSKNEAKYSKPGYLPAGASTSNVSAGPKQAQRDSELSISEEDQMRMIELMYGSSIGGSSGGGDFGNGQSNSFPQPAAGASSEPYLTEEEQMRMIAEIYGDQLDPELKVSAFDHHLPQQQQQQQQEAPPPPQSVAHRPQEKPRDHEDYEPSSPRRYDHHHTHQQLPVRSEHSPLRQQVQRHTPQQLSMRSEHSPPRQKVQNPSYGYQTPSSPPRREQYQHQQQQHRISSYGDAQGRQSAISAPSPVQVIGQPSSHNILVNASNRYTSTISGLTDDLGDVIGGGAHARSRPSFSHGGQVIDRHQQEQYQNQQHYNTHANDGYRNNSRNNSRSNSRSELPMETAAVTLAHPPQVATPMAMGHNDYGVNMRGGPGSAVVRESKVLSKVQTADLFGNQLNELREMGFPPGLASALGTTRSVYPVRFWILDNSGSMMSNDGNSIRNSKSIQCTRWAELEESVSYHAHLAGLLQATTIFRMLNDPGARCGPQEFSIASETSKLGVHADVENVRQIMRKCQPHGSTPLTAHLYEIGKQVAAMEGAMRQKGLEAVVILATDGLPTSADGDTSDEINDEFVRALQYLQSLPVWVVVRLCTDEAAVVKFYNELDSILELPLEVLDDFFAEAKEIQHHNKWLNYAMPLHRCRELGYHERLFDLLDERTLNHDEIKEFATLLYGADAMLKSPDVHSDWSGFLNFLGKVAATEPPQWNPVTKKMEPWIIVKQLKRSNSLGAFKKLISHKR